MATDKQREAARRNGANSRGPKTEAGKAKSARNSTTHGLTSHHPFLFNNEDEEYYLQILENYEAELQPANRIEHDLVKTIALERFRQQRWLAIETAAIDIEIDTKPTFSHQTLTRDVAERQAKAFKRLADNSNTLQLLNRYLNSSRRAYERAMRILLELQDRRRKQPVTQNGTASESNTSSGTASVSESDSFLQNEPPVEQPEQNESPVAMTPVDCEPCELPATQSDWKPPVAA